MNPDKYSFQRLRGIRKRENRKKKHFTRAELEGRLLELKRHKILEFFVKDVDNDFTPTNYFIVEFRLKDEMTLEAFRNMIYLAVVSVL